MIIAKIMNYNRIKAVVVGCSRESLLEFIRDEYTEGEWYPIEDIKIKESFAKTIPGQHRGWFTIRWIHNLSYLKRKRCKRSECRNNER